MADQDLLRLARARLAEHAPDTSGRVSEAAVRLLAELYLVGLRHGISPAVWASVTSLPAACRDATRYRDRFDGRDGAPEVRALRAAGREPRRLGPGGRERP